MMKLSGLDAERVAVVLEGLAEVIRQRGEVPTIPFQINATDLRIELKLIQSASGLRQCGNCRGFRRGQGVVSYCDDSRSPRKNQIVAEGASPCQSYERVRDGK